MKLDDMEQLARSALRMSGDPIAYAFLVVLPVVRAAATHEATRRAVLLGKDTHAELLRRSEDLENAIDTMRAALEST